MNDLTQDSGNCAAMDLRQSWAAKLSIFTRIYDAYTSIFSAVGHISISNREQLCTYCVSGLQHVFLLSKAMYAAQNSKYARPPIPSQPPTQKVFFQWHTQYDPTMKHSHCETIYAKELFQWLFFELVHSLRIL